MPLWRQTAVSEQISTMRSPSPYQPGTVRRCQRVALSASTSARVGRRSPLVRGPPRGPGRRRARGAGGAGGGGGPPGPAPAGKGRHGAAGDLLPEQGGQELEGGEAAV